MERIIAGRFQTKDDADAVAALIGEYIDTADIRIFHNNPPGQHDAFAVGGEAHEEPGAEGAVGAHHGQVVALAAEGVNAYSGPLVGAMAELGVYDDKPRAQERRPDGVMLKVRIANPVNEERVIAALRAAGAADIEPEHGELHDGDWANFNSVAAPRRVASPPH